MENVVLVIHLFLALAIIGLVLLQRSEGGGLGIGGGGGGMGGLATPQGVGNALTKATAICAAAFFCTSLTLGVLASQASRDRTGLADALSASSVPAAIEAPVTDAPETPVEVPSVPITE
ncbi:MAG: preprotein translocase subunit SecG [Bdellovibrionales bacterium]